MREGRPLQFGRKEKMLAMRFAVDDQGAVGAEGERRAESGIFRRFRGNNDNRGLIACHNR